MKNNTLIIGGLAVGVIAYLWYMKSQKTAGSQTKEGTTPTNEKSSSGASQDSKTTPTNEKSSSSATQGSGTISAKNIKDLVLKGKATPSNNKITKRKLSQLTKSSVPMESNPMDNGEMASTIIPKMSNETESFAFTLNF
jgi:hypothetical protein